MSSFLWTLDHSLATQSPRPLDLVGDSVKWPLEYNLKLLQNNLRTWHYEIWKEV